MHASCVSINSSGAIAGIGSVSNNVGTANAIHINGDPTPTPQKALFLASVPMKVKTDTRGKWDGSSLIGFKQTATATTSIKNANTLNISAGGIWRDIRFKEIITFNDGSSLWCLSPGWTPNSATGWMADTGSYQQPGTPDGMGNLTWKNPDIPSLVINNPTMLAKVTGVSEIVDFKWVLVLTYLGAVPNPSPIAECYTGYANGAIISGTNSLAWDARSKPNPLLDNTSSAGGYNNDLSTTRPPNTSPIYSAGSQYIQNPANWTAHSKPDGTDGVAKIYEGHYP